MTNNQLWTRWTLANALSEIVGLGLTFVITGLFFSRMGEAATIAGILLSFVVAVRFMDGSDLIYRWCGRRRDPWTFSHPAGRDSSSG